MNLFYIDKNQSVFKSWEDLINDISKIDIYNPYCYYSDYYSIFKHIIHSLILNTNITLLDSDFSTYEVEQLTRFKNLKMFDKPVNNNMLNSILGKEDLINIVNKRNANWSITLYTSGTTGMPKKIKHTFDSITRFVRISENKKKNIWGLAYNPTHMAGIQVFFQAFLNRNTIVKLFGLSKEDILNSIDKYKITNISATPTFYRLLLPVNITFQSVKRLTSGGEKFDNKTFAQLKVSFPAAKITNVYALTEAGSLFASYGSTFYIKPEMKKFVRINDGELLIHKSLMGSSESLLDVWYHTGDLVKKTSNNNPMEFQFISRKNELINVGGYKVNPLEVEDTIRLIEGVSEVRVFSKKNTLIGNIICCEIVCYSDLLDEMIVRKFLQTKLQEVKIPRIIEFVEEILVTRTGKIKRS